MSDLLSDTLRLVLRRLESIEAKLDAIESTPPTSPKPARSRRSERPEHAPAILDESAARIAEYWATHRQPMHFYKFSGAFAKRWLRQVTDPRSLRTALIEDPRLRWALTEAGGTIFFPAEAWENASPIDRMEWSKSTRASLAAEGQSELDAARQFGGDLAAANPLAAPDAFDPDSTP